MNEGRFRVFLVEDNEDDADLIARAIRRVDSNVEYERVPAIQRAIERLNEMRAEGVLPDLVLVDGRVGGGHATELLAYLQAEGFPGPALVLTGSVDDRQARRYRELGAVDVLIKPVDFADFQRLVSETLVRFRNQ